MLDSLWSSEDLRNGSELLDLTHFCAHFFEEQNDLRYLLFLHCSLFNLHLKKQYSIFHSVASWCCDSFSVALWVAPFALFPVFTLAFPSQPFPGSLPLGSAWIKKTDTKRRPRPNIDWVSGPQPSPEAERLKGRYCSTHTTQQPRLLAFSSKTKRRGDVRGGCGRVVHKLSKVGWLGGGVGGGGGVNRRDNTVTGVRETSA